MNPKTPFSDADLEACLAVLKAAHHLPADDPRVIAIERSAAGLRKRARQQRRATRKQHRADADRDLLASTAQHKRVGAQADLSDAPEGSPGDLGRAHRCYVCQSPYHQVHPVYHRMCPACAEENLEQREARADLDGRRALVTGGRIKIGFQVALKLLRDGASVHVTTRFPGDAARRFADLPDAARWSERLTVHGLDLRDLQGIAELCAHLLTGPPLDIIINNAAQTVHRPPAYYKALAQAELRPLTQAEQSMLPAVAANTPLPAHLRPLEEFHRRCVAQDTMSPFFPTSAVDLEGEPLDLRQRHSWHLGLAEVPPGELAEVWMINTLAPFLLNSQLKPSLLASPMEDRYIVNVSASEGQFTYAYKTTSHPHTNMAKAALNMMTRTSGAEYAREGIYMTSVDPGWVTDMNSEPARLKLREHGFRPPLDAVDCAARIVHPIICGVTGGERLFGVLLKNYHVCGW